MPPWIFVFPTQDWHVSEQLASALHFCFCFLWTHVCWLSSRSASARRPQSPLHTASQKSLARLPDLVCAMHFQRDSSSNPSSSSNHFQTSTFPSMLCLLSSSSFHSCATNKIAPPASICGASFSLVLLCSCRSVAQITKLCLELNGWHSVGLARQQRAKHVDLRQMGDKEILVLLHNPKGLWLIVLVQTRALKLFELPLQFSVSSREVRSVCKKSCVRSNSHQCCPLHY